MNFARDLVNLECEIHLSAPQIEEDRRKDSTYFNRRCRYDKKVEDRFILLC